MAKREPTKEELFTGQKHEYFTVYYNFALKKLVEIINDIDNQYNNYGNERVKITEITTKTKSGFIGDLKNIPTLISDKCYALLKDYLWRAFRDAKNTSGIPLTPEDKEYIAEFCKKLVDIRNFHSHYYHDNAALDFTKQTSLFIENKLFIDAKLANAETNLSALSMLDTKLKSRDKGYHLFSLHDGQYKITPAGRIFFLSFFLNKGEMNRFLDSLKTSKEGAELTNKVFRKILTYYCHRGGVERFKYNHQEDVLSILSPDLQHSIQETRQAFKIISYLNNVPSEITDVENFPLIFTKTNEIRKRKLSNEIVEEVVDIIQPSQGSASDFIEIAKRIKLFEEYRLTSKEIEVYKATKAKGGVNAKQGKQVTTFGNRYNLEVVCIQKDDLFIHIRPKDFQRLIVYAINHTLVKVKGIENVITEMSGEKYITGTWNKFFVKKQDFIEYFTKLTPTVGKIMTEEEEKAFRKEWNEHSFFWKGIDNALKIKLEGYYLLRIKGKKNQIANENLIVGNHETQIENILKEAISIRFVDLFHQRDEILRKVNQFTRFAIQYIIDFNLLPNWYWQHEKYDIVPNPKEAGQLINKRILSYYNTRQTQTISIDNFLQAVAIYKRDGETLEEAQKHKFVLGPKALRNIILYNIENKNSNLFLNQIRNELQVPKANTNKLITPHFLSPFQDEKRISKEVVIEDAKRKLKALEKKIETYQQQINDKVFNLNRNDKNRIIMQLYQLYNWETETRNGVELKFLRKNQYQQMSVYHYYLQKDKLPQLINEFEYMIPNEIKAILKNADSIDDIFQRLINNIKSHILPTLNQQINKTSINDTTLNDICQKLHIKKTDSHIHEVENKSNIPYDIHPMQIIMYHENKEKEELEKFGLLKETLKYETGYNEATKKKIFSYKKQYTKGLKLEYYQTKGYLEYIQQDGSININDANLVTKYKKTLTHKLKGDNDTIQSQDILLWYMAKKYIEKNNARTESHKINITDVGNIRKSLIHIPIEFCGIKYQKYQVELFYHQVDDLIFIESKSYLDRISKYYIRHNAFLEQEIPNDTIEYTKLTEEYTLLQKQSLEFSKLLMFWEESQFKKLLKSEVAHLETLAKDGLPRIDFDEYCKKRDAEYESYLKATEQEKEEEKYNLSFHLNRLKSKIRNKAFHAEIPNEYVYPKLNTNEFIIDELIIPFEKYLLQKKAEEERKALALKSKKRS